MRLLKNIVTMMTAFFVTWTLFSLTHEGLLNVSSEELQNVSFPLSTHVSPNVYAENAREGDFMANVNDETMQGGTGLTESYDTLSSDTHQTPTKPVYVTGENYNSGADHDRGDTTVPLGVTFVTPVTLLTTEPGQPTCDPPLCHKNKQHYTINSSACSNTNEHNITGELKIRPSNSTSLRIVSDPLEIDNHVQDCQWDIVVPYQYVIGVTIEQIHGTFEGSFTLTIWQAIARDVCEWNTSVIVVDEKNLIHSSKSFYPPLNHYSEYTMTLKHRFQGDGIRAGQSVLLQYIVQKGIYIQPLRAIRKTHSTSFVTLPRFDLFDPIRTEFDGSYTLDIAVNESVMISFKRLFIPTQWPNMNYCPHSYLQLTSAVDKFNQTICGNGNDQVSKLYVFQSSIHLRFHAEHSLAQCDFKMAYIVVPRAEEPQLSADKTLVNCSVPHYHRFKSLLTCNMLTECLSGEDELNCRHHSPACRPHGPHAIDTGKKCLKMDRLSEDATWYETKQKCSLDKGSLPTFRNKKEFQNFMAAMNSMRSVQEVYIGAHLVDRWVDPQLSHLYKFIWQWTDGTTAFLLVDEAINRPICIKYNVGKQSLELVKCDAKTNVVLVCEFEKSIRSVKKEIEVHAEDSKPVTDATDVARNVSLVRCPAEHVTRDFLTCDAQAHCQEAELDMSCSDGRGVTVPMFVCQQSKLLLHYTLVCDHMQHCPDNSDESFCQYPACSPAFVRCVSEQCFQDSQRCDEKLDCYDGQDEASCLWHRDHYINVAMPGFPPGTIDLNGKGRFVISSDCPAGHFHCPEGFCLPVYLRCNGIDDCPGREDEADCESYTCPGFYRCHGSTVCLRASAVCDGVPQCPRQDDELLCRPVCPEGCLCTGLAFICTVKLPNDFFSEVRYLDGSESGMTLVDVNGYSPYLVHLRLSRCGITSVPVNESLPNLRMLDLSWNHLIHLDMQRFAGLKNLRALMLNGNPLTHLARSPFSGLMPLQRIDLSHTDLTVYNSSIFVNSGGMVSLNLSWSKLTTFPESGFQSTPLLESIDVTGCQLKSYPFDLLRNLSRLHTVLADEFKLCCPAMLPADFDPKNCHAPHNGVASCRDLLRSKPYRVCLWLFASLSMVGNAGSLGTRLYLHKQGDTLGSFGVFVINLSVADFLMGVYLAIVGVADRIYQGRYMWYEDEWKNSAACKTAGFLSLLSSEVSALMICLITLDRYLVLRFPFSRLHFGRWSALVACGLVWMVGICIATVPLLPMTSDWEFYSQTGICIPLPFTSSERFKGYDYSFSIMILLNLVLFLLIAIGQAAIYWSIRARSIPSSVKTRTRDAAIARRLTTVVVSDFLCWFPVGLLGLLAATGTPIPDDLSRVVAIFVLPFNSALNPFLYTFNVLQEKRRKAREVTWRKRLEACVRMELTEAMSRHNVY